MVDKFKALLLQVVQDRGPVSLFAILKMDDITDKWTVILSAPWATEDKRREDFGYLRNLIVSNFSEQERATIARVGIFPKDEPIIQSLLQYKPDAVIEADVKLNGNVVHEAHILASDQTA